MPDVGNLRTKQAVLVVEYHDEVYHILYNPNTYTDEHQALFTSLRDSPDFSPLCKPLAEVIVDWDVTLRGEKLLVSEENIAAHIPPMLRMTISNRMVEDMMSLGKPAKEREKLAKEREKERERMEKSTPSSSTSLDSPVWQTVTPSPSGSA